MRAYHGVSALAGLGAVVFVCGCAGESPGSMPSFARQAGAPSSEARSVRERALPIVGGELERGHPAVGALTWFGDAFCTGTLVRRDVVVTAAHCLSEADDTEGFGFFVGADARRPSTGTTIPVRSVHVHPRYGQAGDNDIAVVVLERSAPVAPVDLLTRPMGRDWVGRRPLFVGYGVASATSETGGVKRSVEIPIEDLDDTQFLYASPRANTCFGDSGGPALFEIQGRWTLIGVTSWGDEGCREFGVNTRVDPYLDFIGRFTEGTPEAPPSDGTPSAPPPPPPSDDREEDDRGDEGFGRDCDPVRWDSACDEELGELVDDFVDILDGAGEGNGGGGRGCSIAGVGERESGRGFGAAILLGLVVMVVGRRRRR